MFQTRDVADYYNQTLNHYQQWWHLDEVKAVHYGFWDGSVKNFKEALLRLNEVMAGMASVKRNDKILDAGCGVGGSLFYLNEYYGVSGTGITLSEKQFDYACKINPVPGKINFMVENYCKTPFKDESFDVVWAIESVTSTPDKTLFAAEAFRLLPSGGRLIIADYYKTGKPDKTGLLEKWRKTWSMAPFVTADEFVEIVTSTGFRLKEERNITSNIYPTALKMYKASLLGALPSILYNLTHNTSRFAKTHYLSGLYQYRALKRGLWEYKLHLFEKQ